MITAVAKQTFNSQRRMPVIGIVGGIGSGKSAVANWVAAHSNVVVLNADTLGHEALQMASVQEALRDRFGEAIIGEDGLVARSVLAQQVFGTDAIHLAARHDLEQIVHPEIEHRIAESIATASTQKFDAVLLDAAVLLEAGWRNKCDLVVFIDAPIEARLARVREHRGWTEEELQRRESSQWSLTEKRREADLIVTNDGNLDIAGLQLLDSLHQRGLVNQTASHS